MKQLKVSELCPCNNGKAYSDCHGNKANWPGLRGKPIKRHHHWRLDYRLRRYLKHLGETDLAQRRKDIMENMLVLTEDLKIGVYSVGNELESWSILFTHLLEECVLRDYTYPAPFEALVDIQFPKYDWPGISQGIAAFKAMNLNPGTFLVKYGVKQFLRPMLERGLVRVMPAASYGDPSLNQAVRDEELENTSYLPPETRFNVFDGKSGNFKGTLNSVGNVQVTTKAYTNYYVYCLSQVFSPRMFGDFEADSCLIIKSPYQFMKRMVQAFGKNLPGNKIQSSPVRYFDPLELLRH